MKHLATASLIALAAAATPLSAQDSQSPGGFRLPTPTPTPTDVQGPVDPDAPILTRPRAPTPTPTPRATAAPEPAPTPAPRPAATATPRAVPSPRNSTLPPRFTPPVQSAPTDTPAPAVGEETPFPTDTTEPGALPTPLPTAPDQAVPSPAPAVAEPASEGVPGWLYALGGLLAALAIGGVLFLRRRRRGPNVEEAPAIERPRIAEPQPAAPPPAPLAGPPLVIEAQAKQLARSVMFATLTYELRVTNRGSVPLEDVSFGGDLVTAHARVPAEQQLADPSMPLTPVQSLTRLDPGESASFAGEFRLPVSEIRPIPHGKAVVYVPLMRVRAVAKGMDPIARTFIVGLQSPGAAGQRLQPFRLDEMPQTYRAVGQKALD